MNRRRLFIENEHTKSHTELNVTGSQGAMHLGQSATKAWRVPVVVVNRGASA